MKTAILSTDFLISAANDTSDDWHRVCSYGDFPNRAGMQRIDKTAAQQMAASFSGAAARLINWISGGAHTLPAYLGHPDEPAFANTQGHDDTTRYADIDAVEARDDGIYCHFQWSPAWAALKAKMPKLYISPRWAMTETARGSGVYSPRKLLSIGLTPTPNLPFASAVNTDEPEQKPNTMKKDKLLELLKLLGQTLTAEATDEQINTALEAAIAAATKAAADKQAKDDELAATKAEKTAANTALSAANAATAAERKARASDVVTLAIQSGRITAAERAAHEATLIAAGDFTSAANALLAEKTVVKTAATVTGVDQRNTVADASAKFESAVNSRMTATGEDRNTAYQTFAGTSEGKALMEQMKKPTA